MAKPLSDNPILLGNTSYSFDGLLIYFVRSRTKLIWVPFSTRFLSYSAFPDTANWASLVISVNPAFLLNASNLSSVFPNSSSIIRIRSLINSLVFSATSFLSLFVLRLYISINLLIKSWPRCILVFINETTATEVVLEVGVIFNAPWYCFATPNGWLTITLIFRTEFCPSIFPFNRESFNVNPNVPTSVGSTAGSLLKYLLYSFKPIFKFTSNPPSGVSFISTKAAHGNLSASCAVKFTITGEVLYNSFLGNSSSS